MHIFAFFYILDGVPLTIPGTAGYKPCGVLVACWQHLLARIGFVLFLLHFLVHFNYTLTTL